MDDWHVNRPFASFKTNADVLIGLHPMSPRTALSGSRVAQAGSMERERKGGRRRGEVSKKALHDETRKGRGDRNRIGYTAEHQPFSSGDPTCTENNAITTLFRGRMHNRRPDVAVGRGTAAPKPIVLPDAEAIGIGRSRISRRRPPLARGGATRGLDMRLRMR